MKNILFILITTLSFSVSAKDSAPPVIDAFISVLDPTHLNSVRVNIENSTASEGKITISEIDFGDGFIAANKADVVHTYTSNALFNIKITITDQKGKSSVLNRQVDINSNYLYNNIVVLIFGF